MEYPHVGQTLGVVQAGAFQAINPKAWVFVLGAVTTFRPTGLSVLLGSLVMATTMLAVAMLSSSIWALAGDALGRWLSGERTRRLVAWVLAALVVATIVLIWV